MAERITEIITAELFRGAGDRLGGHGHEGLGRGPSGAYGEGSGRPRTARGRPFLREAQKWGGLAPAPSAHRS